MNGTNWHLLDFYTRFNKQYFGNRLPKDMPIYYTDIEDLGKTTLMQTAIKGVSRPLYIEISKRIRFSSRLSQQTVLHEMIHVAHPNKRGHRGWFDKEMLKLMKRKAMNGLW
jgi:hypothetical protein